MQVFETYPRPLLLTCDLKQTSNLVVDAFRVIKK